MPVEIPGAIPFDADHEHAAYDGDAVRRFWLGLVEVERVFTEFRSRFVGKASPVHLFWGALDLAVTRFSGRTAPPHPGGRAELRALRHARGVLARGQQLRLLAGRRRGGRLLLLRLPRARRLPRRARGPEGAAFVADLGEFVLPYEAVRTAADPEAALLEFLQTTYEAAADLARWDRPALERRAR